MIQQLKYFSIFSGIGGFEYGIQQALPQAECVGYSEIDKYSIQTYEKHYKHKNYGDATKINPEELPDFDMLCGGFPCQAFSIAGKRRGFKDTRGTLFFDIARIVKVKRPKIVLLENVKGLLNHEKGKTFRTIIQTLSELGYDVQWMVLNSKFFGVPQNRERVFIIGSLRGTSRTEILPFAETNQEFNLKYIGAVMSEQNKKWLENGKKLSRNFPQGQRVYSTEGIASTIAGNAGGLGGKTGLYCVASRGRNPMNPSDRTVGSPTEQRFEINKGGTTNTLSSVQKDNLIFNGMQIRRLTPTECERLQGFPDGWTEGVSDTQRYKQCGNAVTTKVIKSIIEKLSVGKFTLPTAIFPTEKEFNKDLEVQKSKISSPKLNSTSLTSPNPNIIRNPTSSDLKNSALWR